MFATISNAIAVLKGIFELWKYLQAYQREQANKEAEKRQTELEKAVDDAKKAKTPEEAWDAQDRIVSNKQ